MSVARETVRFTIPGRPVPAARPRVTRNGTYYPRRYQTWLDSAKVYARQAWLGKAPLEGDVEVHAAFYGARDTADIDNLTKGALDAISGSIINDDKQVAVLRLVRSRCDSDCCKPGTWIEVLRG